MADIHDDPIDRSTELFREFCAILDSCEKQPNATCSPDIFSGGFKFSDEAPDSVWELGDRLRSFVDLMRCLWGYRASVVRSEPRADLAAYWDAAKAHAPRWPGFSPERSAEKMMLHVDAVNRKTNEFITEMDRIDRTLAKKRTPA